MPIAIVTGSGGLIGSEAVGRFSEAGYDVIGFENDMRAGFFGADASTRPVTAELLRSYDTFTSLELDIRNRDGVERVFADHGRDLRLVVHTAAQPSHDWAASDPHTDFEINANGTLNLLEATRQYAPTATFVYMSTNKVYGDSPNLLPLVELETRLDLPTGHPYYEGIDTSMSVDRSTHSLFGVSKVAGDLMVQEYGRYFGIPTVCFRGGCLTGPAHAGAKLHGFLSYLVRCAVMEDPYTVLGYGGKQVRDNIHSADVVAAIEAFHAAPKPAAVYNLGGGRQSNCSILEAITIVEDVTDRPLDWRVENEARRGDHRWWVSDLSEFRADYPGWEQRYSIKQMVREIYERNVAAWVPRALS